MPPDYPQCSGQTTDPADCIPPWAIGGTTLIDWHQHNLTRTNWEVKKSEGISRIAAACRASENCWEREPVKAVRVTAEQDGTLNIAPLALPRAHRKGEARSKWAAPVAPKKFFALATSA